MYGKRFQKELDMLNKALESEAGEKFLCEYIKSYVESVVDSYIKENSITNITRDILIDAGWTYLKQAIKGYLTRAKSMLEAKNNVFYFATYFNWYIRQGVLEYLQSVNYRKNM